jgi:uncharacterized membrane protein
MSSISESESNEKGTPKEWTTYDILSPDLAFGRLSERWLAKANALLHSKISDDAASLETFRTVYRHNPDSFWGLFQREGQAHDLVGFYCQLVLNEAGHDAREMRLGAGSRPDRAVSVSITLSSRWIVAELVVLGFKDMSTADEAVIELEQMQKEALISVADWARVIRRPDGKVDIRQGNHPAAAGALGGTFWGLLFGLIFFVPFFGAAIGAASGALIGALTDVGIDDKMIKELGNQIVPGSSALFIYVVQATGDKVAERMRRFQPEVLKTSMSNDAEEKLRQALAA